MIRPVVVEMGKACTFPDCDCDSPYRAAGACVKPAQAAERAVQLPPLPEPHDTYSGRHYFTSAQMQDYARAAVAALPAAPAEQQCHWCGRRDANVCQHMRDATECRGIAAPAPAARVDAPDDERTKRAQNAAWVQGGGFFHRFAGQDHACMPLAEWRQWLAVVARAAWDTAPAAAAVPVPLSAALIADLWGAAVQKHGITRDGWIDFARAIEAAHGITQQPGGEQPCTSYVDCGECPRVSTGCPAGKCLKSGGER